MTLRPRSPVQTDPRRSAILGNPRLLDLLLLLLCLAVLGATVAYPLLRLLASAIPSWQNAALTSGAGAKAIRNTFVMGMASVVAAGFTGSLLAYLVTLHSFPGRSALSAMAFMPFALPPLVGTLSFYYLIGPDGFIPRWVRGQFPSTDFTIEGPIAVLLIHTYSFAVFFYAMVGAALEGMDGSQIEAARTLGASRLRVFWKIVLPMLTPALVGASLLTFLSSGASFSAPLFFGSNFPYLSVQIYKERSQFHSDAALTLTLVLALIAVLGVGLFRSRKKTAGVASKGAPRPLRSRSGRFLAGALAWLTIGLLLTPHATILWLSFVNHREWYSELLPTKLTLENYLVLFRDPAMLIPVRNSLWMGVSAAALTLGIGFPAAYLIGRNRPGSRWINLLVMLPWALPGTVIAMNLITAFNDPWLRLYNTVLLLPLAYFIRNIPLLTRMLTAAVAQFDVRLIEAGRTLGASRTYCFRHIVAPLLAPSIVAATALVFVSCLGEFVASILLYTPSNLPIAIEINMQWRGAGIGSAFAYSSFLMLLVSATFLIARRVASRVL